MCKGCGTCCHEAISHLGFETLVLILKPPILAINARALGPKLSVILGWGHDLLATVEARVGLQAKRALMRVARSCGYDVLLCSACILLYGVCRQDKE